MKRITLFCAVIALLLVAGLLMPVGVYATDAPPTDVTVNVDDGNVAGEVCVQANDGSTPAAVTVDVTVDGGDSGDASTSETNAECGDDDDGSFLRVSWNS